MKKRIKTLVSLFVVGAMTFSMLTGCGSSSTSSSADSTGSTAASTDSTAASSTDSTAAGSTGSSDVGDVTLVMAQRDEFLSAMETGAKNAASELGISLNTVDAQSDTSKMIQFIETAKNNGEKAIIINMVDPETAAQCVEAAGDMKVVFVNRYPSDPSVLNENVVYVGSDENTSGKFQGEWLAEYFKGQNKTSIKYILLNGILGQTSTTLRTESVLKALKDNGITAEEAAAPLACDYDRAMAIDMISPLLSGGTEFDCIISNNDSMALGAIEAMKTAGMDPAKTPVVGIDATVDGIQAIKDGTLAMTVFQDADGQGYGSLVAVKNLIAGNALNEGTKYDVDDTGYVLWVPFEPVTPDNVKDYE